MKQNNSHRAVSQAAVAMIVASAVSAGAQSQDPLTDALIKKGVLTEQEAKDIKAKSQSKDVRVFWKDGLNFESGDKKFKGKLGGRVDIQVAGFSEDADVRSALGVSDLDAGVEFRRARLSLEGEYASSIPSFYKVEVDFASPNTVDSETRFSLKDVYLGLNLPYVGNFQAGHFKEPIGLELLTSSRFLTFVERAAPIEAFAPERNTGVMLYNSAVEERMTWALGVFTDVGDTASGTLESDFRVDGRITGLPWYDEEAKGSRFLHLGVSGSYMEPQNEVARYRARPEAHLAPRFVDTRVGSVDFAADHAYLFGGEVAAVCGPFSVQAEYLHTWVETPASDDMLSFNGFYVSGSWFITGEHRSYRRSNGTFDRVRPKKNLGEGPGAWELAARYSRLDLHDTPVSGGKLDNITAGVNWYLNPNMKFQFNYIYSQLDRGDVSNGETHIVQAMLHVDF